MTLCLFVEDLRLPTSDRTVSVDMKLQENNLYLLEGLVVQSNTETSSLQIFLFW